MNTSNIFLPLGINPTETTVLLSLLNHGEMTVTQISRNTKISRATLYRALDRLKEIGVCTLTKHPKTTKYQAADYNYIKKLLYDKQEQTTQSISNFDTLVSNIQQKDPPRFQVNTYNGRDEVKQLFWNTLKTEDTIRSFGYRSIKEAVGIKFLTEWFNESTKRGQQHLMIANPETFEMKSTADKDSKYKFQRNFRKENFFIKKVIPRDVLPITIETFIYDDIYAIVQWEDKQVYGIEVTNPGIAQQERNTFKHLWEQAKDWPITD